MENYIPVLTPNRRPLAPCHPNRAKGLVRQEKASFKHRSGIRIIILNKTKVPKLKNSSKIQLRMDPGAKTTGMAVTRNYPDGSRDALMTLEITHQGRAVSRRLIKRRQLRRNRRYRKLDFTHFKRHKRGNLQYDGTEWRGVSVHRSWRSIVKNPPTPTTSGYAQR